MFNGNLRNTINYKICQRIGKTQLTKEIQLESIDDELKSGLWNIYNLYILDKISGEYDYDLQMPPTTFFSNSLWHHYFKKPTDEMPDSFWEVRSEIRIYFFNCDWYNVYDIIEFTLDLVHEEPFRHRVLDDQSYNRFNAVFTTRICRISIY